MTGPVPARGRERLVRLLKDEDALKDQQMKFKRSPHSLRPANGSRVPPAPARWAGAGPDEPSCIVKACSCGTRLTQEHQYGRQILRSLSSREFGWLRGLDLQNATRSRVLVGPIAT